MRLGGPTFSKNPDPDSWINELQQWGYTAAYCPINHAAAPELVQRFAQAAQQANILIAEVGAWSNPLSPDDEERNKAIDYCQKQLALADAIGARCCVNIAGSRGEQWDGPHPDNLTQATFELIVDTTRAIIDAVKPTRTFFSLEPMPWMYPDSPASFLDLIRAIDRPQFAAHLDPVNWVNSPQHYFRSGDLIRESVKILGPYIKSCHAKDIALSSKLTTHLDEVRPGLGGLDYATFLREVSQLDPDTPLMLEHLSQAEEYRAAGEYIRSVAQQQGIAFV